VGKQADASVGGPDEPVDVVGLPRIHVEKLPLVAQLVLAPGRAGEQHGSAVERILAGWPLNGTKL